MTVAQLRATMSSYEYSQWIKFYLWEQDERNKQIALQQANANKRRR